MILKEKQLTNSTDPRLKAGEDVEKQMAFYLSRTFRTQEDFYVINDLRVIYKNDTAQIDHLVVTQYGLFIVESKSVYGKITVNTNKEWARTYNKTPSGMASPVLQAEAQGKVVKALLSAHAEQLLGKLIGLQRRFGGCPFFIYVAISDTGIIERKSEIPELFKADQVAKEIELKLKSLEKSSSILNQLTNKDATWFMSKDEAKKVADFLHNQHSPLIKKMITSSQVIAESKPIITPKFATEVPTEKSFIPKVGAICPKCNQHKLVRKSISRSDGTETDFLACAVYPKECKAIFALVAVPNGVSLASSKIETKKELQANDNCPQCSVGKLVSRKKKTEFLGCSQYPKCNFTSYRNNA